MKITIGNLKALIREAGKRDSRMSGGKVGKALNKPAATNPEVELLKKDIRAVKSNLAKQQKAGKVRELEAVRAYIAELEEKLKKLQEGTTGSTSFLFETVD